MDAFEAARAMMVEVQLRQRGIDDARVLAAMGKVPRERFVPAELADLSYGDSPLAVGHGQTISQPYVVAYMTEAARLTREDVVLDVGTGSGYQTAILAELVREVHTIEIVPELAARAQLALEAMGYGNIHYHVGDGARGVPEAAPFDAIIVAAAPRTIPKTLVQQLSERGRLVLPIGDYVQTLTRIERRGADVIEEPLLSVRFVPMVGEAETPASS
jgi:protein-L-isoaspartate(D-aspartate) O-methyltransferase